MKKFTKVSLITAGILAALGCILCLISSIAGGRMIWYWTEDDSRVMEKLGQAANKLDDAFDHLDHFAVGWNFHSDWDDDPDLTVNNAVVAGDNAWEAQQSLEGIRELDLMLGAGSLILKEKDAPDGMIDIYVQGKGGCDYKIKEGTLYVEGFKGITTMGSDISENVITLVVPKGTYFSELELEVGAGVMEISGVDAMEIDAQVGAGGLLLHQMETQEFSAEVGVGRIEASDMISGNVSMTVSMGEGIYKGTASGEVEAECDMGNIEFVLKEKQEDFNYSIECSAGSIKIGGAEFTGLAREQRMDNHAFREFEAECNMGNIVISFEE